MHHITYYSHCSLFYCGFSKAKSTPRHPPPSSTVAPQVRLCNPAFGLPSPIWPRHLLPVALDDLKTAWLLKRRQTSWNQDVNQFACFCDRSLTAGAWDRASLCTLIRTKRPSAERQHPPGQDQVLYGAKRWATPSFLFCSLFSPWTSPAWPVGPFSYEPPPPVPHHLLTANTAWCFLGLWLWGDHDSRHVAQKRQ